jgi:hypothetical protein
MNTARTKEYALIGVVENDESRPNTEIIEYIYAENDVGAIKQARKVKRTTTDFTTDEKIIYSACRLVELRDVGRC